MNVSVAELNVWTAELKVWIAELNVWIDQLNVWIDQLNVWIDKLNKQKNKANITIPNQQGLIRITMALFSSAILVRSIWKSTQGLGLRKTSLNFGGDGYP